MTRLVTKPLDRPSGRSARAAPLLLAAAVLALGPSAALAGEPAAVVRMTDGLKFAPFKVTVHAGDTVEWRSESVLVHTVTADPDLAARQKDVHLPEGAKPFDSGNIDPGGTYRHTFPVPGTYRYFCIPHETAGMIGEVVVEG